MSLCFLVALGSGGGVIAGTGGWGGVVGVEQASNPSSRDPPPLGALHSLSLSLLTTEQPIGIMSVITSPRSVWLSKSKAVWGVHRGQRSWKWLGQERS